jgi:hypothetical protein
MEDNLKPYLVARSEQLMEFLNAPVPWETLASLHEKHFATVDAAVYSRGADVKGMLQKVSSVDVMAVLKRAAETCEDVEEANMAAKCIPIVAYGPVLAINVPPTALDALPGDSGTLFIPITSVADGQAVRMLYRGLYEANMAVLYDEESSRAWALVVCVGWGMKDSKRGAIVQSVHVLSRPETPLPFDPNFAKHRSVICESDVLVPTYFYSYLLAHHIGPTETNVTRVEEKRNVEVVTTLLRISGAYPTLVEDLILHPAVMYIYM